MRIISLILFVLLSVSGFGQGAKWEKSKEMGVAIGTAYYLGDINRQQHFGGDLSIGGGFIYRENITKRWTVKGSVMYGRIEASDEDSDDPWQRNRNLSFRNDILEGAITVELNYFNYQISNNKNAISPYLFTGLAAYNMKPQAEYNGKYYELQPLGTEGQGTSEGGKRYSTSGVALPLGLGLKVNVASIMAISLEWGMRKTWTDYIDDVSTYYVHPAVIAEENGQLAAILADRSIEQVNGTNEGAQRGDPGNKDWYSFAHLMISFRIDKKPTTCWK